MKEKCQAFSGIYLCCILYTNYVCMCKFINQYLIVRNVAPKNVTKFVYQTVNPALAYHDLVIIVQTSFPFSNVRCEWYPPLITRKCESHYSVMVLPTFLLHFLPLLDLGVTIGRKITIGIQIEVCFHLYICQNYFLWLHFNYVTTWWLIIHIS